MTEQDTPTLMRYAVGSVVIIAGAALVYIGKPDYGLPIIVIGLGLFGYAVGYTRGFAKAKAT